MSYSVENVKLMTNDIVANACLIATEAHTGQFRKYDKQPYIIHPKRTVALVEKKTNNRIIIAATWVHDVVEDTDYSTIKMVEFLGVDVFALVLELTNPSQKYLAGAPRAMRKMVDRIHLMHVSPEAKLIKLCDRLDNVLDVKLAPDDFKKLYKKETEALLKDVFKGVDAEYEERLRLAVEAL